MTGRCWAVWAAPGLFLVLSGAVALAQQPGGGPRSGRQYDPTTEKTVSGVVERVERVSHDPGGKKQGVHLWLKTDSGEELSVHLGPTWYVDEQPVKITANDRVEVRGSAVVAGGRPALIAAEVRKGGQTLILRSPAGIPAWAGQGGRAPKP